MNQIIVNWAKDGREPYEKGQDRLYHSLQEVGYEGAAHFWRELPPLCPPHETSPQAYKIYLMWVSAFWGADLLLWCDASVVALKNPKPIFEIIEHEGYFFVENLGYPMSGYATDYQLSRLEISREDARTIPQCCAGLFGISMKHPMGVRIMADLLAYAYDPAIYQGKLMGTEPSDFVEPRHDQIVLSGLIHRHKLEMVDKMDLVRYTFDKRGLADVIFEFRAIR